MASPDVDSLPRFLESGGLQGPMHDTTDSGYFSRYNLQSPTGEMKKAPNTNSSPNLLGESNEGGGPALFEHARLVFYQILHGTGEKTETYGAITADQIIRNMMPFEAIPLEEEPLSGLSEGKLITSATTGDSPKSPV
jgi:hypothetical protein